MADFDSVFDSESLLEPDSQSVPQFDPESVDEFDPDSDFVKSECVSELSLIPSLSLTPSPNSMLSPTLSSCPS